MNKKQQDLLRLAKLISATGQEIEDFEAQIAELESQKVQKLAEFNGYSEELAVKLAIARK